MQLLTPAERRFTYYSLSLGYNLLPGEVYIGRSLAMNSALYLLGGIGSTKFAGDQHFSVNFGAGYRLLPTDWLAIHIDVQDRVFQVGPARHGEAGQQPRREHRIDRCSSEEPVEA